MTPDDALVCWVAAKTNWVVDADGNVDPDAHLRHMGMAGNALAAAITELQAELKREKDALQRLHSVCDRCGCGNVALALMTMGRERNCR